MAATLQVDTAPLWGERRPPCRTRPGASEGDYFEACNCASTCPCIFPPDPDEGDCQLTLAWHVRQGWFGQTRLDDLNVAGVFHTPGNMVTGPKWRAALHIDERATEARLLSVQLEGRPALL